MATWKAITNATTVTEGLGCNLSVEKSGFLSLDAR